MGKTFAASGVIRRARSPLDSENLSLRNIPIFRIQQRRRRIPLAPPPQLFPFCPTHSASNRRPDSGAATREKARGWIRQIRKTFGSASGVIRRAARSPLIRKISAYATFLFSEFNSDGEGTACATTADISRSVPSTPPPNCRPDSGGGHPFPAEMTGWIRQIRKISWKTPLGVFCYLIKFNSDKGRTTAAGKIFPVLPHIPIPTTSGKTQRWPPR